MTLVSKEQTSTPEWSPSSWRHKESRQMPEYTDKVALKKATDKLCTYPPLVFAGEVQALKSQLADVAAGKVFLLQGGDCAESFNEFSADSLRDTLRVLLQMAIILTYATKKPVVKIGRVAGQFAKPRSADTETQNGITLPSYRGDIINDIDFTEQARVPQPLKMLDAYRQAAASLNLLRAFASGGYAALHHVSDWNMGFVQDTVSKRYAETAQKVSDAVSFMEACGITASNTSRLRTVDFYTSHEALLLEYEEALTRTDSISKKKLAGSGHMLWIGDRTRQPDGAHVEYCRGVMNPLGIKCGPSLGTSDLLKLIDILNPSNEAGRITLICRFGHENVEKHLPDLIKAVQEHGKHVIWSCDPMHGNTIKASNGYKTRPFENILTEVRSFFDIHEALGTYPGGIHLELTGKDVTECLGGIFDISETDLSSRYHTACDPRLNANQSLELAFLLSEEIEMIQAKSV
jgi:3-deoxy-7-phosphoheptulonate synthase